MPKVTQASIRRAIKAADALTKDGDPFHEDGPNLIQRNRLGEWHGYHKGIWKLQFNNESEALLWLNIRKSKPSESEIIQEVLSYSRHDSSHEDDTAKRFSANGFAFASGLSRSNQDIDAAISAKQPIGVSVHDPLSENIRRRIIDYCNAGGMVFVDSGAFTTFTKGRQIEWETIMGRYKELFYRVLPENRLRLHFVAPDVVGDPTATAELLQETYGMFQFVMEDGGNIIVPIHKEADGTYDIGAVDNWFPRCEFPERFILGIPFNKVAWSQDDVLHLLRQEVRKNEEYQRTFGRSVPLREQLRIHLLGGGPRKVHSLLEKIQHFGLTCGSITGDSFHGPARDRKFENRKHSQPVTPQRGRVNKCSPTHTTRTTEPPPMKSNITPESDFASSNSQLSTLNSQPAFTFRPYQKEDLARAAMHDGAIIGWDPGLGKTMAIFALPFLKSSRFTLIVAPAGLHEQIMDEGREKFGITVTPIPNQDTALRMMRNGTLPTPGHQDTCGSSDDPRFFITSYNWLGYNGGDEWAASEESNELIRARRLTILLRCITFQDPALAHTMATAKWKPKEKNDDWTVLSLPKTAGETRIRLALRTAAMLFHPAIHGDDPETYWRWQRILSAGTQRLGLVDAAADLLAQEIATDPALLSTAEALASIETGIGHERELETASTTKHTIKCVFEPTLSSLVCGIFDCVICDEAVRLKSGTAYVAQGVLRMESRSRYLLTGTPIKNKLPDFFFLASWVTGHTKAATARWPYGNTTEARGEFSRDFGVVELNLTKQELAQKHGKKAPPPKTTNQICNVHRLWRILGPVVIRRRKDDVQGVSIVKKTIVPIRVMPGARQKQVYSFHLTNAPKKRSILASIGAQLQNLRQAALNPSSTKLTHGGKDGRSLSLWTPKFTAILKLAADLLEKGEQLVIFSPFQDFSSSMGRAFRDAGIQHLILDGNLTPEKRGSLIKRFKSKEVPILIAGIDSMGEGYSLDNARHLILPSLSWAFDSNTQAVERVHRLTSKLDVTIYVMVTIGTIDERLCSIWQEKGDSSDLALDGRLITTEREEIDLGTLLRDAVADFDPKAPTLCEDEVARHWRAELLPTLTAAGKSYIAQHPQKPETSPATVEIRRPAATIRTLATTAPATPTPRLNLFELMKQKRNTPSTPPPAAAETAKPANIIAFPIRPAASKAPSPATPPPFHMPKVNIAALLRK